MSKLLQNFDANLFEQVFKAFLEQADNNAISKKSEGGREPPGFEGKLDFDEGKVGCHYGLGGASKSPYFNWDIVSIYYLPENGNIKLGIQTDCSNVFDKMEIKPESREQIGNRKIEVAIFYSTSKENVNYPELHEKFIAVCKEVMRIKRTESFTSQGSLTFTLGVKMSSKAKFGTNKIFYGAPGCGKSRHVSDMLEANKVSENNIIRVTFHPEYANCDFIGQILPTVEMKKDDATGEENEFVKYIFNPGPFTLALQKAYDTNEMVFLIIEEINRGNAAAIFGDMFQLLDRGRDINKPNYCSSEYPVTNPNMQKYLFDSISDETIKEELKKGVFIPSNLTIYATMNSSDQNVFTLDTAFKRRWAFEQISNDITKDAHHAYKHWHVPGTDVTWADFLTNLNSKILDYKLANQTNEDKRLGKYFVSKDCLVDPNNKPGDVSEIAQNFAYKVLEYVWNDVCKIGREDWFDTKIYKTLEDLVEAFVHSKEENSPLSVFQNITFEVKTRENIKP